MVNMMIKMHFSLPIISNHLGPIISQPLESVCKFWARLMSSTHTIMGLFQYFPCLFLWKAAEQDPVMRSTIQCSRNRIIVKFGGFPSDGSRFFSVLRQDAVQDIVDIGKPPVSRFRTSWWLKCFFAMTTSLWLLIVLESNSRAIPVSYTHLTLPTIYSV